MSVKAKKHLGQHFLTDENIARKIVEAMDTSQVERVLEVGPGMGVLTKYLLKQNRPLLLAEIDEDSISYLQQNYPEITVQNFVGDFLRMDFSALPPGQIGIIGNFPYNISSQILFQILDHHHQIPEMVGMFQKEVAERVAAKPRTKAYGILSVLMQAFYHTDYLFTVHEQVFNPPPKVKSGVIRMVRQPKGGVAEVESEFKKLVKTGFNQRRKKLSNALKPLGLPGTLATHPAMDQRAEELSVEEWITFAYEWKQALT